MPKINAEGFALIRAFEGCVLSTYLDATGIPTIGYGHCGPDVVPGMRITQAQADDLLAADLDRFEREVNALVTHDATSNQFSALVSFQYNTGALGFSHLLACFNARDLPGAADQFGAWIYAGGMILPGLVRRRAAERALFLKEDEHG